MRPAEIVRVRHMAAMRLWCEGSKTQNCLHSVRGSERRRRCADRTVREIRRTRGWRPRGVNAPTWHWERRNLWRPVFGEIKRWEWAYTRELAGRRESLKRLNRLTPDRRPQKAHIYVYTCIYMCVCVCVCVRACVCVCVPRVCESAVEAQLPVPQLALPQLALPGLAVPQLALPQLASSHTPRRSRGW